MIHIENEMYTKMQLSFVVEGRRTRFVGYNVAEDLKISRWIRLDNFYNKFFVKRQLKVLNFIKFPTMKQRTFKL